jgi:anti-sigma B factor antagonist
MFPMSQDPAPSDHEASQAFRVAVRASTDRTAVLALRGEVDLATVAELRHALEASIQFGVHHLNLDCAELEFIDASGVGLLVAASDELRAHGGRLVLRNASVPVQIVLEASGRSDLLDSSEPGAPPHSPITRGHRLGASRVKYGYTRSSPDGSTWSLRAV